MSTSNCNTPPTAIMVAISLVRSSNESLRNLPRHLSSPTAVFTGATQGIGLATLRQLAIHTVTPTCYIVGRSEARVQEIIGELKELNARGTYVCVKGEVALLERVDECCGKIKGMLGEGKGLDLLYMSQGYLSFGGRNASLFRYFIQPLIYFFEIPFADVGDRQLFHATSARYPPLSFSSKPEAQGAPLPQAVPVAEGIDGKKGSGAYLATKDSDVAPSGTGKLMTDYRERGVPEKVWKHTLETFEKVRGG
ncbi:MAG: hypothetical protein Q9210_006779 [Variospora velana]